VSVDSAGAEATGPSRMPSISEDGRFVSFYSGAPDLVADDTNLESDVFVKDLQTAAVERISVDSNGNEGNDRSESSAISADGRFVAFASQATNFVASADVADTFDIFVKDRLTGAVERVSLDSSGAAPDAEALRPEISDDGRFVAFDSEATNLVDDDTNSVRDIFVHDRLSGITERVNVDSSGDQATGGNSFFADLSGDGRLAVFQSLAGVANLVPDDTNAAGDTFLRDRGLQPDGRNDFLADFGGAGTWQRLNDTAWQKIHNGSPAVMAAGDLNGNFQHEAVMSFGAAGLWVRYDNLTWVKLHNGTPQRFVTGDFDGSGMDDLVVDFGGAGLWVRKNDSTWKKLHNATSQDMAAGDLDGNGKDELIVDFGGAGLWVRINDTTWAKLHNASPTHIATGYLDGDNRAELIADFGGAGLWVRYNNTTWAKLHNATSQGIVTGDVDGNDQEELIVDFGGAGLWVRYNNATWAKRHNASPQRMLATDLDGNGKADLVVDFGGAGLWVKRNNGPWTKIHNATTQDLAAGGFD
jgi:hypothetical protein